MSINDKSLRSNSNSKDEPYIKAIKAVKIALRNELSCVKEIEAIFDTFIDSLTYDYESVNDPESYMNKQTDLFSVEIEKVMKNINAGIAKYLKAYLYDIYYRKTEPLLDRGEGIHITHTEVNQDPSKIIHIGEPVIMKQEPVVIEQTQTEADAVKQMAEDSVEKVKAMQKELDDLKQAHKEEIDDMKAKYDLTNKINTWVDEKMPEVKEFRQIPDLFGINFNNIINFAAYFGNKDKRKYQDEVKKESKVA